MPWSGSSSRLNSLLTWTDSPTAEVTESDAPSDGGATDPAQAPKQEGVVSDDDWDNCQEIAAFIDGDYTLVEDFSLLDIKPYGSKDLPIAELCSLPMPAPDRLDSMIGIIRSYIGNTDFKVQNGKTERFAKILDQIDQSLAGTYALTYKQHASCSALLQRCIANAMKIKELEAEQAVREKAAAYRISELQCKVSASEEANRELKTTSQAFKLQVAAHESRNKNQEMNYRAQEKALVKTIADLRQSYNMTTSKVLKTEGELERTKASLGDANETLRDFAQQINSKDEWIAKVEQEIQERESEHARQLSHTNERIDILQKRVEELEHQREGAKDAERELREELDAALKSRETTVADLEERSYRDRKERARLEASQRKLEVDVARWKTAFEGLIKRDHGDLHC
jgi:hypothetical protein